MRANTRPSKLPCIIRLTSTCLGAGGEGRGERGGSMERGECALSRAGRLALQRGGAPLAADVPAGGGTQMCSAARCRPPQAAQDATVRRGAGRHGAAQATQRSIAQRSVPAPSHQTAGGSTGGRAPGGHTLQAVGWLVGGQSLCRAARIEAGQLYQTEASAAAHKAPPVRPSTPLNNHSL